MRAKLHPLNRVCTVQGLPVEIRTSTLCYLRERITPSVKNVRSYDSRDVAYTRRVKKERKKKARKRERMKKRERIREKERKERTLDAKNASFRGSLPRLSSKVSIAL